MFSFYLNHQCFPSAIQSQVKLLGFINLFASDTHLLLSVFRKSLSVNPGLSSFHTLACSVVLLHHVV